MASNRGGFPRPSLAGDAAWTSGMAQSEKVVLTIAV